MPDCGVQCIQLLLKKAIENYAGLRGTVHSVTIEESNTKLRRTAGHSNTITESNLMLGVQSITIAEYNRVLGPPAVT